MTKIFDFIINDFANSQNYVQDDNTCNTCITISDTTTINNATTTNFGTDYDQNMIPKSCNRVQDDDFDTHYSWHY